MDKSSNEFRLADVTTHIVDCPHSTPRWTDTGILVLRSQNIRNGRLGLENPSFTDSEGYQNRVKRAVPSAGDLVFTREAPMGEVCMIPDGLQCCLGQRMVLVRANESLVASKYLLYVLQSPYLKHQFSWHEGTGTTVSNIRIPAIKDFLIPLPPLPEQKAIAHILGTLDDKIELNRQTNKTLEDIARAIFKSWFVDFDPVRYKRDGKIANSDGKTPYSLNREILDLFPDKFQDSELGEIPEGWEVSELGEVIELAYGKALKKNDRVGGEVEVFGSNGIVGTHNQKLVAGPGIVVGRKGNPGTVKWAQANFFPIDTTFYVQRRKDISLSYLFHALVDLNLGALGSDSAVPGLNREMAYGSLMLLPQDVELTRFDVIASIIREKQRATEEESKTLTSLRDTLLPKLISGELRIKDAEKFLKDVPV